MSDIVDIQMLLADEQVKTAKLRAENERLRAALQGIADTPDHLAKSGEDALAMREEARDALASESNGEGGGHG